MNLLPELLASTVLLIGYIFCLVQSASEGARIWKVAPYAFALIPPGVHAFNYGFGVQTWLALAVFLGLTRLLVFCAIRELGEK